MSGPQCIWAMLYKGYSLSLVLGELGVLVLGVLGVLHRARPGAAEHGDRDRVGEGKKNSLWRAWSICCGGPTSSPENLIGPLDVMP